MIAAITGTATNGASPATGNATMARVAKDTIPAIATIAARISVRRDTAGRGIAEAASAIAERAGPMARPFAFTLG